MGVPENLKLLDDLDHEIWDLKKSIDALKLRADALQQESDRLIADHKKLVTDSQQLELKVRDIESKSQDFALLKVKLEKQLLEATSVKMEDASRAKLAEIEQSLSVCEEDWLQASEDLDEAKLVAQRAASKLKESQRDSSLEWDQLNIDLMEAQKNLPFLVEQRAGFLDGLESGVADLYESRRKTDQFKLKIFEIEDENCPNCSMQLTSQLFERVRYADEIQKCPSCGVIIYWRS